MVACRDLLLLASLVVSATAAPRSFDRERVVRDPVAKRTWLTKDPTTTSSTMSSSTTSLTALSDTSTASSANTALSDTSSSTASCSTDGSLVCSSDGSEFGICNFGKVVFQAVAAGTMCKDGAIINAGAGTTGASISGSRTSGSRGVLSPTPKWTNATSMSMSSAATPPSSSSSSTTPTSTSVTTATPLSSASGSSGATIVPPPSSLASSSGSATSALYSGPASSSAPASPSASLGATSKASDGQNYHVYLGNGQPSQGWPTMDQWAEFDDMWTKNLQSVVGQACSSWGQPENSDEDNTNLKNAILSVGKSSDMDPRFILAVVLQESVGCVRVITTNGGVTNPGLMQSHDGTHSCYQKAQCPDSEIVGMIQDGVDGTSAGPGLKELIAQTNTTSVAKYYMAARMYNSGSIASNGLLQCGIATQAYCSDIANRLTMQWYRGYATFPTDACPSS